MACYSAAGASALAAARLLLRRRRCAAAASAAAAAAAASAMAASACGLGGGCRLALNLGGLGVALRRRGDGDAVVCEEAVHGVRGLRADGEPVLHALLVDLEDLGVGARVVVPQDLDEVAVALGALVGDHHSIAGLVGLSDVRI